MISRAPANRYESFQALGRRGRTCRLIRHEGHRRLADVTGREEFWKGLGMVRGFVEWCQGSGVSEGVRCVVVPWAA